MFKICSHEWRSFILALGFFTRISVPSVDNFQESDLNHAVKYFPLIGVLVGAIAALIFTMTSKILPQEISIILSMMTSIYVTGAFHEDGLADAVDGLGGGWEKQQVLMIMQDSRIGSYGAVAIILALLLKFTALSHVYSILLPAVLVVGHSMSRLFAVFVMATQPYVKTDGKSKPLATDLSKTSLVVAMIFGLLPLMILLPKFYWAIFPMALIWAWFSYILHKRIGGYTGDCLGAMQQMTEIAFYLGMLACTFI